MTTNTNTYQVLSINQLRELLKRAKEGSRKANGKVKGSHCEVFHGELSIEHTSKRNEVHHRFLSEYEETKRRVRIAREFVNENPKLKALLEEY